MNGEVVRRDVVGDASLLVVQEVSPWRLTILAGSQIDDDVADWL